MKNAKFVLVMVMLAVGFVSTAPVVFAEDEVPVIKQNGSGGMMAKIINDRIAAEKAQKEAEALKQTQLQPVSKFTFTQTLKRGSVGGEVSELQKILGVTVDGKFGLQTKGALVNYQISKGLKGDGVAGVLTRGVLNQ